MGRIQPFNRLELLSSDFDFVQSTKSDQIKNWIKDQISQPGILPITDFKAFDDMQKHLPNRFPIILGTLASTITVGAATPISASDKYIAYDADGERIQLPENDQVTFKADTPIITTTGVTGSPTTPFSTGRIDILTPNIPGAGSEERFVFIAHLEVTKTLALPPDHENIPPTGIGSATNNRRPVTGVDSKQGIAYAHHKIDGYRIYVALPGEVDTSGAFPVITSLDDNNDHNPLNPNPNTTFPNFANAIYIGKYSVNSAGVVSSIQPSGTTTDTTRPILRLKPIEVVQIPDVTEIRDFTDPDNPIDLLTYQTGTFISVNEHISTIGTGTVTPRNPHGNQVSDFTAGQLEPDLAAFQAQGFSNGILDDSIETRFHPSNAPLNTTALQMDASVGTGVINGAFTGTSVKFAAPANAATPTIFRSGLFDARVEIKQLNQSGPLQLVYVEGTRLEVLSPTLTDAGVDTTIDGFIPFSAADQPTEGTYTIFVMQDPDPANPNVALLGVAQTKNADGSPGADSLDRNRFVIAEVYWRPGAGPPVIQRGKFNTVAEVLDKRSTGLVGTTEISTSAQSDPNAGLLAQQTFYNILQNPDFRIATVVDGTIPDNWNVINTAGTLALTIVDKTDTTLTGVVGGTNPGPKTDFGGEVVLTPAGTALDVLMESNINRLKPNTVYTLSFWMRMLALDIPYTMSASLFNTAGLIGVAKTIDSNKNVTTWQRMAVSFTTTTVNLDDANNRLVLSFANPSLGTGAQTVHITSVSLVEGEWTTSYTIPRIYQGEIFMWDKNTACPPGSEEVTNLQGKYPIGATGVAPLTVGVGSGVSQTNFIQTMNGTIAGATAATFTGSVGNHNHGITGGGAIQAGGGFGPTTSHDGGHFHTIGVIGVTGTATVNATLSQYVVKFCRRL